MAMSLDMFLHAIVILLIAIGLSNITGDLAGSVIIILGVFASIGLAIYSGKNDDVGLLIFRRWLKED